MELQIHNEETLEIVKLGEMTEDEAKEYAIEHRSDINVAIKGIIGQYTGELLSAAEAASVELDLSYETIKNIPAALMMLYGKQYQWGYSEERNRIITCRTLAAYITLLIMNNSELYHIGAKTYSNRKNESRPEMWADYIVLRLNNKKNSDMLPYVWEGANRAPILIENGLMIDITPLAEGYKRLTGVDLAAEGLPNMVLTHGEENRPEMNEK